MMSGIQQTTLRIPDVWDAHWFRVFVTENLAKADVRNAIGQGVTITSIGNSVATISADAETAGAVSGHNDDPLAHAEAFAAHVSHPDPHPQYLREAFPVGSLFLTIGNTNPGTLLGYGTWSLRASGLTLTGA
jgi:hypothetical protein